MAGATEWEDALIKHGIMQAPPKQETEDDRTLARFHAKQEADKNNSHDHLDEKVCI
jgi:hypothetical protein